MSENKLAWAKVDVSTLPTNLQKAVEDAQAAAKKAAEARETLRKALEKRLIETKRMDPEHELIVSFKFGGVSVAKKEREVKKATKPSLSW
jgi:heterodisulfide reductase subunit A-like polyferredoxin